MNRLERIAVLSVVLLACGQRLPGGAVNEPVFGLIGDVNVSGEVTTLKITGIGPSGDQRPTVGIPPFGPFDIPVEDIAAVPGKMSLAFHLSGALWKIDGTNEGERFKGRVRVGGIAAEGACDMVRFVEGSPSGDVCGVYRDTAGTLLICPFGEFGDGLFGCFEETGDIGPIYRVDKDDYVLCATIASPALPLRGRLHFEPSETGAVSEVVVARTGSSPRYLKRDPIRRVDVTFPDPEGVLAGSLLVPDGAAPRAGIVLVHGSGPADRTQLGPWAYFFASQGLVVLCYDKRGTGASAGDWKTASLEQLAGDAAAAVSCLRGRSEVNPRKVGIWGISQGGWILPQVAAKDSSVAFLIAHAAAVVTPAEQALQSLQDEMRAYDFPEEEIRRAVDLAKLDDEVTRGHQPWKKYEEAYQGIAATCPEWLIDPLKPEDSWFRSFYRRIIDFNPIPYWEKVQCPTLVLCGEKDLIVSCSVTTSTLNSVFRGRPSQLTTRSFASCDHVMFEAERGVRTEYPSRARIDPRYFTTLRSWLQEHQVVAAPLLEDSSGP